MKRTLTVASWILQILIGVLFVLIGTGKFGDPSWARSFERWGYPPGFHLVAGVIEIAGGVALLVPAFASYAAGILMAVMTCAALTHLVHGEMGRLTAPIVYLVLLAGVAWLRRGAARHLMAW
jgi:uncharacterized membrane protein YphA (DoxX/SURF4 family)